MPDLRQYSDRIGSALVELSGQLQYDDPFERTWHEPEWESSPARFRKVGLLIQVVDHGIEHRTNITTILAARGLPSPTLDGWEYMRLNPTRLGL